MASEWNGEYYELCRDCHDYPCRCIQDELEAEDCASEEAPPEDENAEA